MKKLKNYTDEELNIEFKRIINYYKSEYQSQEKPKAFLLGGQPGAGKSSLESMINIKNEYISISGDDYRKSHPRYKQFNRIYGKDSSIHTQQWAGEMVEKLVKELKQEKYNIILEGTIRTAELPIKEAKSFKENNYNVELFIVAVKPEISYLSTIKRYEEIKLGENSMNFDSTDAKINKYKEVKLNKILVQQLQKDLNIKWTAPKMLDIKTNIGGAFFYEQIYIWV